MAEAVRKQFEQRLAQDGNPFEESRGLKPAPALRREITQLWRHPRRLVTPEMSRTMYRTLGIAALAVGATACGQSNTLRPAEPARLTPAAAVTVREPTLYVAYLTTVNREIVDRAIAGTATIAVSGDRIDVTLEADAVSDGSHIVMVQGFADGYRSAACPTPEADRSRDGVIDALEASRTAGTQLIPLNAGMSELDYGAAYPVARGTRLLFSSSASETWLLARLRAKHRLQNPEGSTRPYPGLMALRQVPFERYSVVVYGVPESTDLPHDWLQPIPYTPWWQSIPIACGELMRVR